jgi:predicted ATPase
MELGATLAYLGEFAQALKHLEQGIALYDPQKHRSHAFLHGQDFAVSCLARTAHTLWFLGYPDQALKKNQEALALARDVSHSHSLAYALVFAAQFHQLCRQEQAAQEKSEAAITLSTDQGFPIWIASGIFFRGWALAEQGQIEEGITQIRQGLACWQAAGAEVALPYWRALLAEAYGKAGKVEQGLSLVAEVLAQVDRSGERAAEAELYRLKGELVLQSIVHSPKSLTPNTQHPTPNTQAEVEQEAEGCSLKAIEIARRQQAKSLEQRAVMSLVRLRQQQATQCASRTTQHEARTTLAAARNILSEIYGWFTEGFDTADLQEARVLLEEVS